MGERTWNEINLVQELDFPADIQWLRKGRGKWKFGNMKIGEINTIFISSSCWLKFNLINIFIYRTALKQIEVINLRTSNWLIVQIKWNFSFYVLYYVVPRIWIASECVKFLFTKNNSDDNFLWQTAHIAENIVRLFAQSALETVTFDTVLLVGV